MGEFKGSSQHLKKQEELRWRQAGADGRIVPIEQPVRLTPGEAVNRMREFGKGRTLGPDLTVRDLIEFGRK